MDLAKIREVDDSLGQFDIVALQETWIEKDRERECIKKLDKVQYNWTAKVAVRVKTKGRTRRGVIVGLKKEIEVGGIEE